jgi:NADH:ubiquinone oxidoreductase subunit 4 (subunit M)
MLRRAFYGPLNLKWSRLTDTSWREAFPLIALTVVIVLVGIFPKPIIDLISPSLQQILGTVQTLAAR